MKTFPASDRHVWLAIAAAASLAPAGGCSSVIGSAYLRDAWLDAVEHAAETRAAAKADGKAETGDASGDTAPASDAGLDGVALATDDDAAGGPPEGVVRSRFATLGEAMAHADRQLASSGGLSSAARDTLTAMLQTVPPQDWPAVVDEFTATLSAAAPSRQAAADTSDRQPAREPVLEPAAASVPDAPLPPARSAASAVVTPTASNEPAVIAPAAPELPAARSESKPAQQPLAINNACFATRVRGWGAVDRFEHSRFVAGQEVIVYFEIDQLAARESVEGHTTRIDTSLRLVAEDGRTLHEWTFEPLEETCRARRRDYFARYVLTIPDAAPAGPCRIEIGVTDAVGNSTAQTTLPLELRAR